MPSRLGGEYLGEQCCFEPDEVPARPAPQVTQALVLRAFQRIPVPASKVSIQPPGGKTLVNLETIFSTEAAEFTRTIGLLGHRVDLEISPSAVRVGDRRRRRLRDRVGGAAVGEGRADG